MRVNSYLCVSLLLGCSAGILASNCAADEPSPNIVLMMADDMGMGDTSAYQDVTGNTDHWQIHTPNMERLARMGVRFTDAHTPTSRCSGTRYGLMTGRYPWRSRLKFWVLFGAQGDPMIEPDRPTLATLLKNHGYSTGIVGKWHIGLRYSRSDGQPADAWQDADLSQPLCDTPLDHGFDTCQFTSRSHGTSGVAVGGKKVKNNPGQTVGPGHIDGRTAISATGNGKQLKGDGDPDAYVLSKLGSRHLGNAIDFMKGCTEDRVGDDPGSVKPFFLYYASNSNHAPYTPDAEIGGVPVLGHARNTAGEKMEVWKKPKTKKPKTKNLKAKSADAKNAPAKNDLRHDFIYENDVVLGRLMDFLRKTDDPRRPGHPLIENTIVIFTSDNGAERNADYATGPFRSHKGSAYEGGHRVPLMVSWPVGAVGDGDDKSAGETNETLTGLQDMYATFSEVLGAELPDWRQGQKGGEDSTSVLAAWRGKKLSLGPLFHNDHSGVADPAAVAFRMDDPIVDGTRYPGKWKLFFDGNLIRFGADATVELYDLQTDPEEQKNRVDELGLKPLVAFLRQQAIEHRVCGGHRIAASKAKTTVRQPISFLWTDQLQGKPVCDVQAKRFDVSKTFQSAKSAMAVAEYSDTKQSLAITVQAVKDGEPLQGQEFHLNDRGLGVGGGKVGQVDEGEAIAIRFDKDVYVQSAAIVAGNGQVGGSCKMGGASPLAIYCVDDDIDAKDQSGLLSDLGVLKAGETMLLDSSPHYGVEQSGRWRLAAITVRLLGE